MTTPCLPDRAYGPTPAASTQVAVTTAVQTLTLPAANGGNMRLVNNGTAAIAWCYGPAANLSMTNGVVMLPNTVEIFDRNQNAAQLSVIGSAAGSTLIAHIGNGI